MCVLASLWLPLQPMLIVADEERKCLLNDDVSTKTIILSRKDSAVCDLIDPIEGCRDYPQHIIKYYEKVFKFDRDALKVGVNEPVLDGLFLPAPAETPNGTEPTLNGPSSQKLAPETEIQN